MKIIAKVLILISVLVVLAVYASEHTNESASAKIKDDARATADKARDTTKDVVEAGKQKTSEIVSNVSNDFKEGLHKADEITTNAVGKIKEGAQKVGDVVTNVAGKVKEKAKEISR